MVKRTDLTPDAGAAVAALGRRLAEQSRQQTTVPHGVKDMGRTGDTVWTRPDGTGVSVRVVDEVVEQAKADVQVLRDQTLPALRDQLAQSAQDVAAEISALDQRINDIIVDGGGAGNFTTYSVNAPSGSGSGAGDTWWKVQDGQALGQWRWDGSAWVPVTLSDAVLAGIDVSKLQASTGHVPSAVVDRLFADIFTAHKITGDQIAANTITGAEIKAGSITGEKLSVGAITADKITGGSFVGETFEGGAFIGGEWRTSDALPGRVTVSDRSGVFNGQAIPGIEIEPIDTTGYKALPYIGPSSDGMVMSGGRSTSGATSGAALNRGVTSLFFNGPPLASGGRSESYVVARSDRAFLSYISDGVGRPGDRTDIVARDGSAFIMATKGNTLSQITTSPAGSEMYTTDGEGVYSRATIDTNRARLQYSSKNAFSKIEANDNEATIWREKRVNGVPTRFDIFWFDENGLTYKQGDVNADGSQSNVRWTKFGDSGWIDLPGVPGIAAGSARPVYRALNSVVYFQGSVQKTSNWTAGWNKIATLPSDYKPGAPALRVAASTVFGKALLQVNTGGVLEVWVDKDYPGSTNLQLSTMTYPFG